jgi:hypothetical protein
VKILMSVQEELMNVTRPATTPLGPIPVVVMQDTGWPQMGGPAQTSTSAMRLNHVIRHVPILLVHLCVAALQGGGCLVKQLV